MKFSASKYGVCSVVAISVALSSLVGLSALAQTTPGVGEDSLLPNSPQSVHAPHDVSFPQWPLITYPPSSVDHDVRKTLDMLWMGDGGVPLSPEEWIERFLWTELNQFPSKMHPSACVHRWHRSGGDGTSPQDGAWHGARLNLDPHFGPEPPTLPPLSAAVATSSSPLLPAGQDAAYAPMVPVATRELAGGAVDLVTGVALLSAIDFELPFGGATFRYQRTYADSPSLIEGDYFDWSQHEDYIHGTLPLTRLWDWHGVGWMLSHNPVLLIDAGFPGLGGARLTEDTTEAKERFPRRSYFIPDAHHSIPFDFIPPEGSRGPRYEAPPRFGATLEAVGGSWDGDMNNGLGGWEVFPHTFHVWLHNGAVKYTIKPIYEDVRSWDAEPSGLYEKGSSHDHASAS